MKNAIVVSLESYVSEIISLTDTLDYNVINTFIQARSNPDVNSFIGKGKLEEIKKYIDDFPDSVDLVVVNGELRPSQWFLLEKQWCVDVFDRIHLILSIFEKHAERKEAKLQVRLAQLEYERPFVRELIHRARNGEHPGFMAGGEYQVDDYYEMIKKQGKKIKEELASMRNQRELRRVHRHKGGFYLVSLAGYTNAGKSSLLNLLTEVNVKVDSKLFSTLSTTTKKIKGSILPVLLTDTVGFIRNLPSLVIDAFHSTLEEIAVADVVLLVVDVSEDLDIVVEKLNVSLDELVNIGVKSSVVLVFNKCDLISQDVLDYRIKFFKDKDFLNDKKMVFISVKNDFNINNLSDAIYSSLPSLVCCKIKIPLNDKSQSFVSWIYETAHVLDISYDDFIIVSFESTSSVCDKIVSRCKDLDGLVLS
ncbi:MAG: GTPase HflX [Euryarchaeota archaeon RBG_13_31_8]|nr:MAG: GTPase HflX [Euryarchaeota archaeon RBG_13_31_8]